jgi:hypothetical protein
VVSKEGIILTKDNLAKVKLFMWYLKKGFILTKENLAKRNWQGRKTCEFCFELETIRHLFFQCHYAKFLWHATFIVLGIRQPILKIYSIIGQNKVV